jgi:hypothetical protein
MCGGGTMTRVVHPSGVTYVRICDPPRCGEFVSRFPVSHLPATDLSVAAARNEMLTRVMQQWSIAVSYFRPSFLIEFLSSFFSEFLSLSHFIMLLIFLIFCFHHLFVIYFLSFFLSFLPILSIFLLFLLLSLSFFYFLAYAFPFCVMSI